MNKKTAILALAIAITTVFCSCTKPTGASLPLKPKSSEKISEESLYTPESESEEETFFETFSEDESEDTVDKSGAHFSLDSTKYIFYAGEDFLLPVPTVKNSSGEEIDLAYNARVYDENGEIIATNADKVRLDAGYYSLRFSFKDNFNYKNTLSATLIARDPEDITIISFNTSADFSRVIQPPLWNYGTRTATYSLLQGGFNNSVDGVLKITPGTNYANYMACRDGAGITFASAISVSAAKSFKVSVYQDTDESEARVIVGFYGDNGAYTEEFWNAKPKDRWRDYEYTIEDILAKKWHVDSSGKTQDYSGQITKITGIYVKNIFCVDPMYIDNVTYKTANK